MKAEPSPTAGSFFKPQSVHYSRSTPGFSLTENFSNKNTFDERKNGCFEYKPHAGSDVAGLPAVIPTETESFEQVRAQCHSQAFASMPSNKRVQTSQSDHKDIGPTVTSERSSDDGYNWRKYGQKLVKGSEFPRSYYKCTHPNCEVKKIFECSQDGQITEMVYKGTHDHPKPQPTCRFHASAIISMQEQTDKISPLPALEDKPAMNAHVCHKIETNGTPELFPNGTNDDSLLYSSAPQLNGINDEVDKDGPFSKRRKVDAVGINVTPVVKPIREPCVVVQTMSEVDILDDGYRWHKYGQKLVGGNPNPRSYYKCTNAGCPLRKHVERASHDPKAVIITYEEKHNHDLPTRRTSSHDMAGPATPNSEWNVKG